MADEHKPGPQPLSSLEEIMIGAVLFGFAFAFALWVFNNHDEEIGNLLNLGIGKVSQWVQ
jgi:hypothetical protein